MFKNYLKTAFRNLLKKKTFSFLNIAGLAIGIACASLIFLWVEDELTFNYIFPKRDNLYKIYENQAYQGKTSTFHATPGPMAAGLKTDIPGIKNSARLSGTGKQLFSLADKAINETGDFADPAIFSMLDLAFIYGIADSAFKELHSIVINETMANNFFGNKNPVGKTLRFNNEQDLVVTGVFKDLPVNSTFQFHWLVPIENIEHKQPWMQSWGANWAHTYVELQPLADITAINKKLSGYIGTKTTGNNTEAFLLL